MSNQPLVSVFLPTYNQENFISESIESALNQTYRPIEIVIGDDCSQDNTWDIVRQYQKKYPDLIKAFRNAQNLGITGNCNAILSQCTGKYMVFMAGDDLIHPDKVKLQVAQMESNPHIVLSYHDVEIFESATGKTLSYWNSGKGSHKPFTGCAHRLTARLVETTSTFLIMLSAMIRRSSLPAGGYNSRIPIASDWLLSINILGEAADDSIVAFLPEPLAKYRRHSENVSKNNYSYHCDMLVTLAVVEDQYPALVRAVDKGRANIRAGMGIAKIYHGDFLAGRPLLWRNLTSGYISWRGMYWLVVSYFPMIHRIRVNLVLHRAG